MDFRGKKVFLVGGSKGIGRALALKLAGQGAHVWIAARGQADLDAVVAEMKAAGPSGRHGASAFDVTDVESVRAAVPAVLAGLEGLDVLICNSGVSQCAPVAEASDEHFRWLMDVNYFGHVNVTRAFAPHFITQRHGQIVLVSSVLGFFSMWGYAGYSASKYAIHGFASAFRQEMMLHGVQVRLYAPGTTDTPGYAKENEDKPALINEIESASAFNGTATPEYVADHLYRWMQRKQWFGYPTWENSLMYHTFRLMPGLARFLADQEVYGAMVKLEKRGISFRD